MGEALHNAGYILSCALIMPFNKNVLQSTTKTIRRGKKEKRDYGRRKKKINQRKEEKDKRSDIYPIEEQNKIATSVS